MLHKALFPGSFDPITLGHYDIIMRASKLFGKVYVAIGINSTKQRYFSLDVCTKMIEDCFVGTPNVEVIHYEGLTVDLCKKLDVHYVVRGIRNVSDFEYERSLAEMNKKLNPQLETIFLDSKPEYITISSSIIRELLNYKGDIKSFVPEPVLKYIYK